MAQKILLKHQIELLQKQFAIYDNTEWENLKIVAKLFALNSDFTWYLITQDPKDPNYLYGFVTTSHGIEAGSFSLDEITALKWHGIPQVERDIHFEQCSVKSLWDKNINANKIA